MTELYNMYYFVSGFFPLHIVRFVCGVLVHLSSFCRVSYCIIYHDFFIHLTVDRHLGCFQYGLLQTLPTIKNPASVWYIPRSGITMSHVLHLMSLNKHCQLLSWLFLFTFPPADIKVQLMPHPHQDF